ncbi:hypothetical protein HRbin41_00321 [bacterium HR41]|nr:hypothetical protein HRbin41_00321 [bacterium HR41]
MQALDRPPSAGESARVATGAWGERVGNQPTAGRARAERSSGEQRAGVRDEADIEQRATEKTEHTADVERSGGGRRPGRAGRGGAHAETDAAGEGVAVDRRYGAPFEAIAAAR